MDFGSVLHKAQKNEKFSKKEPTRCYSTKFEPPKKEQRNKQQLSDNIKKFLAKKEAEEKRKRFEALKKREELLALRSKDKKATRCMNVMLKRTKSANQSVLRDAIDSNDTSVTLAGAIQPDEDDYGYVSQEASAFYNKMMEKYSKMPDDQKFSSGKKRVSMDLAGTKERVRAAIEREKEEANMPHRRKRKQKVEGDGKEVYEQIEEFSKPVKTIKSTPMPPPLNFNDLLKLAEKKQYEPIVIEQKPKDVERPLTKKQKKELEREKEWRDRKQGKLPPLENKISETTVPKPTIPIKKNINPPKPEELKKVEKKSNVPSSNPKIIVKPIQKKKEDLNMPPRSSVNVNVNQKVVRPPQTIRNQNQPPESKRPKPDFKPKQFPPTDVRRKDIGTKPPKNKLQINKRRIMDDDDEDEDSEMDDFIDDGPEEDDDDYSKHISEIFGYDKARYRYVDDDVDNMESTFAQQMREEVISTKIGIMEDLEDMKLEEEQKRRKALLKKKIK